MIYLTSDLHFSHHNIIRYCNRPFESVHFMNKTITENWNDTVKDDDIIYILGDITLETSQEKIIGYLSNLKGKIIIIQGNHDKFKQTIQNVYPVFRFVEIVYNGKRIFMCHDWESKKDIINVVNPDIVLAGHVHEKWTHFQYEKYKITNVGVDIWDFKPVSIDKIINLY